MRFVVSPSSSSRRGPSGHRGRRVAERLVGLALAVALLATAPDTAASDKAAAESLFNAGKTLMDEERYAEACEKFAGSMDAEPSVGAQLNLALCHEKQGKVATAWRYYEDAALMAKALNDSRRERGALKLASQLEPKVSRVTIRVAEPIDGLRITQDGEEVAGLDEALPIDPGMHRLEASAPGHQPWSKAISIPGEAIQEVVTVPALEPIRGMPAVVEEGEPLPTWQLVAGWSAIGVGGLGLTVGTVFGILATSDANRLESACGADKACPDDQLDDVDRARTRANVSTGTLIVGGALAVGGVVLLLLDPIDVGADATAQLVPELGPQGARLTIMGRF